MCLTLSEICEQKNQGKSDKIYLKEDRNKKNVHPYQEISKKGIIWILLDLQLVTLRLSQIKQQQYHSFPSISYYYGRFGLGADGTGLGTGFMVYRCFGLV